MPSTPQGMEEKIGEVTCFAPWSSVTEAELLDNLLVIRLSSKQEAVIPGNPPYGPPLDLEEIRDFVVKSCSGFSSEDAIQ